MGLQGQWRGGARSVGELFILQLIMSKETLPGSFPASLPLFRKPDVSLDAQPYFVPYVVDPQLMHCR